MIKDQLCGLTIYTTMKDSFKKLEIRYRLGVLTNKIFKIQVIPLFDRFFG